MPHHTDSRAPRARRLTLVPREVAVGPPLPAVVPLLRPDQPVTPAQDALLTAIARRARLGDREARDLLWRAFRPRMEPAVSRCGRMTWQARWALRNGRPWALEDLHQEAWLVFADLTSQWDGQGSFIPYITAYFPWRLRTALRAYGPKRWAVPLWAAAGETDDGSALDDAERIAMLDCLAAALPPGEVAVLRLRAAGYSLNEIARHLGVCRRTVTRRWARIRRMASVVLVDPDGTSTYPSAPVRADQREE